MSHTYSELSLYSCTQFTDVCVDYIMCYVYVRTALPPPSRDTNITWGGPGGGGGGRGRTNMHATELVQYALHASVLP